MRFPDQLLQGHTHTRALFPPLPRKVQGLPSEMRGREQLRGHGIACPGGHSQWERGDWKGGHWRAGGQE